MNLFEFENEQFPDLWNKETIKELKEYRPPKNKRSTEVCSDDLQEDLYRQYQEANWCEYFDWAGTYRYCLWR